MRACAQQQRLGLVDQALHPTMPGPARRAARSRRAASRRAPRRASACSISASKPERLRLVRQQRRHQPAEPDAFLGEIAPARLGAEQDPTSLPRRRRRSRRARHRGARAVVALGHAERNAGLPDLGSWRAPAAGPSSRARPGTPSAMVAASKPRMVCRISGARMPGSMAGWAQANIRRRRSSGIGASPAEACLAVTRAISWR